jgi:hypothetical protein
LGENTGTLPIFSSFHFAPSLVIWSFAYQSNYTHNSSSFCFPLVVSVVVICSATAVACRSVLIRRRATVEPDHARLFTCGCALLVSLLEAMQADAFVVVVRLSVTAELARHAHTFGEDLCMPIYFFSI